MKYNCCRNVHFTGPAVWHTPLFCVPLGHPSISLGGRMLTRFFSGMLSLLLFCIGTNVYAQDSQVNLKGGLGVAVPAYDQSEPPVTVENKIGIGFQGGLEWVHSSNFGLFVEGGYWSNGAEVELIPDLDASISSLAFHGGALISSGSAPAFYGLAGVGFIRAEANIEVFGMSIGEDESGLSITAGVGVKFPVAEKVKVYVEGRYQHAFIDEDYKIMPISAGLSLSLN